MSFIVLFLLVAHMHMHPLMTTRAGFTDLHTLVYYAEPGWSRRAAQIIDADPSALDARDHAGKTPMDFVFGTNDPYELPYEKAERVDFLIAVLRHRSLDPKHWDIIPTYGGTAHTNVSGALPAVLRRSADDAAKVVHRMSWTDVDRLHTALLCMNRVLPRAVQDISPLILSDVF